ncbi:hypothetical protein C8Q72DRAFT_799369, partial [Fomitopsis betulina]
MSQMLIIATKTIPRLYYDSESQTLTMTLPHIDHKAVIGIWREAMKSTSNLRHQNNSRRPHMVHRTTPWMTRVIVNDSDDKKWLDSLLGMKIGKNHRVDLGPLEVGGSQHLHGRQGVTGHAQHNITLKRVVKKKEKECSDEEPIGLIASGTSASEDASQLLLATAMYEALAKSQLHKISGRYPHLSVGESSPCDTTILLPETGPWKQGDSKLIVGVLRMLWFHVPFNKINEFYR